MFVTFVLAILLGLLSIVLEDLLDRPISSAMSRKSLYYFFILFLLWEEMIYTHWWKLMPRVYFSSILLFVWGGAIFSFFTLTMLWAGFSIVSSTSLAFVLAVFLLLLPSSSSSSSFSSAFVDGAIRTWDQWRSGTGWGRRQFSVAWSHVCRHRPDPQSLRLEQRVVLEDVERCLVQSAFTMGRPSPTSAGHRWRIANRS